MCEGTKLERRKNCNGRGVFFLCVVRRADNVRRSRVGMRGFSVALSSEVLGEAEGFFFLGAQ